MIPKHFLYLNNLIFLIQYTIFYRFLLPDVGIPYSVKLWWWKSLINLTIQNFSYQNLALRKFWYCIFYGYNLLTWVCPDLLRYNGTWKWWNLEVRTFVLAIQYPKEGRSWRQGSIWRKAVTQSIWAIFIEVDTPHHHRDQLPAVTLM